MLLDKPALHLSGCESGNNLACPIFSFRSCFTYFCAPRTQGWWWQQRRSSGTAVWLWGLGRRTEVGWEILISLSLMPLQFGLGICCEIQKMYAVRIHRAYLRFGTFAKECIRGVWENVGPSLLAEILLHIPHFFYDLWTCLHFSCFEGTQWSNFGFLQLKPKLKPNQTQMLRWLLFFNKVERKVFLLLFHFISLQKICITD